MKTTNKSSRLAVICILLVFVLISGWRIAGSLYNNKCRIIRCSPASWETIRDLALSKIDDDFKVQLIMAKPAISTDFTDVGPSFITIKVEYVSKTPYPVNSETRYPVKSIRFDDQTLITTSGGGGWYKFISPQDTTEILKRVTVHPRDAFRVTWQVAQNELAFNPTDSRIAAILSFDKDQNHGRESAWRVLYSGNTGAVYVVDAQTAEIVSVEKLP